MVASLRTIALYEDGLTDYSIQELAEIGEVSLFGPPSSSAQRRQ